MDTDWLVRQAKLHDLQNRLGFVVSLARNAGRRAGFGNPQRDKVLERLESTLKRSLLAGEEALGETKLSDAEHRWLKRHRPKEARDWNVLKQLATRGAPICRLTIRQYYQAAGMRGSILFPINAAVLKRLTHLDNQMYSSSSRNGELPLARIEKNSTIVVSALRARAHFGELLRRVEDERQSLVIERRGTPKAVLLSIRDYVRLASPEPEVLRIIGEESQRKGTDRLTPRQINNVIQATRAQRTRRR